MKLYIFMVKSVLCYLLGIDWIVSPVGETCCPVPVYIVMEDE